MTTHPPSTRSYLIVFLALLALLALTVGAAFLDLSRFLPGHFWGLAVALTIAIAKGVLILLYFMHVKSGPQRVAVFAAAGFVWLGILTTLTMSDYLTRNHPAGLNPKGEPRFILPAAEGPDGRRPGE